MGYLEDTGAGESASFWTRLVNEARDITREEQRVCSSCPTPRGRSAHAMTSWPAGRFSVCGPSTTRAQHRQSSCFEGLCMQSLDAYLTLWRDGAQLSRDGWSVWEEPPRTSSGPRHAQVVGHEVEVVTSPDVTPRGAAVISRCRRRRVPRIRRGRRRYEATNYSHTADCRKEQGGATTQTCSLRLTDLPWKLSPPPIMSSQLDGVMGLNDGR